jgi:hypothetical protein
MPFGGTGCVASKTSSWNDLGGEMIWMVSTAAAADVVLTFATENYHWGKLLVRALYKGGGATC